MKKRIISCLCALAIMMSLGTATALASEKLTSTAPIPLKSAKATFSFSLLRGAASSSSAAAYKNDTTSAAIYPQSGYLYTGDSIAFRIRDNNRAVATGLYTRTNLNSFTMWYNSGCATIGDKYLYANAPSNNYSQYVSATGVWYP